VTAPRVLDAGCGLGGTMIAFASKIGGTYLGLTLSERQADIGRQAIMRAGLDGSVRIQVQSYDAPTDEPYDWILAIESFAHSADPAVTVSTLVRRLAPHGVIAIVDDMPGGSAAGTRDLAQFKSGWRCPVLWTPDEYERSFSACGLDVRVNRDLTSELAPRTPSRVRLLEHLNRALFHLVPSVAWRALMDSYHGGLALERLYQERKMQYRLLIAERPNH
jgi:tocopherol O-methyltransferase